MNAHGFETKLHNWNNGKWCFYYECQVLQSEGGGGLDQETLLRMVF